MSSTEAGPRRFARILIVEDNQADVDIIRLALEDKPMEFSIQVVRDGETAMRLLDDMDADESIPCPDVILLDINVPRRDGFAVLRRIRSGDRRRETRVVMLSSSERPSDVKQSEELGAQLYFRKPLNLDDFLKIGDVVIDLIPHASR